MKINLYRQGAALVPAFRDDADKLAKIPEDNAIISAKLGQPRHSQSNRKTWATVAFFKRHIPDTLSHWAHLSEESIYQLIKAQVGYGEWYKLADGRDLFMPHSTRFDEQTDELEYQERFAKPAALYIAHSMGFADTFELDQAMRSEI